MSATELTGSLADTLRALIADPLTLRPRSLCINSTMPGVNSIEIDGTLGSILRALIRAEHCANQGLPGDTSKELRAIIDLMLAQLESAPKRSLAWD